MFTSSPARVIVIDNVKVVTKRRMGLWEGENPSDVLGGGGAPRASKLYEETAGKVPKVSQGITYESDIRANLIQNQLRPTTVNIRRLLANSILSK